MQKAYDQMNVHLHHAISDRTGLSGLAITDAILDGERDPARLAELAHPRIKATRATLIKALEGDWRSERARNRLRRLRNRAPCKPTSRACSAPT